MVTSSAWQCHNQISIYVKSQGLVPCYWYIKWIRWIKREAWPEMISETFAKWALFEDKFGQARGGRNIATVLSWRFIWRKISSFKGRVDKSGQKWTMSDKWQRWPLSNSTQQMTIALQWMALNATNKRKLFTEIMVIYLIVQDLVQEESLYKSALWYPIISSCNFSSNLINRLEETTSMALICIHLLLKMKRH